MHTPTPTQANTFEAAGGGAPAAGLAGLTDGVRVAEMLHDMYVRYGFNG